MACERKLLESEATTGFFVLLGTKGKKDTLEWCMKSNLIASRYECPRCKKEMRLQERKRERLTATNGVAAASRKIIPTTSFGVAYLFHTLRLIPVAVSSKQNNSHVVTPHMDIIYRQTSGLGMASLDIGDICVAECIFEKR
ncbi:uncharacterized protein TNCV_3930741 [Trichonephila clavipes]|nr:uncharacterized protein TNCV_3930741 [Trichonephila clavipes]